MKPQWFHSPELGEIIEFPAVNGLHHYYLSLPKIPSDKKRLIQLRIVQRPLPMVAVLKTVLWAIAGRTISPANRDAELIALRHQIDVLRRKSPQRVRLTRWDRFLFALLYRLQPRVLGSIAIVKPETVVGWHRQGFRLYWRWRSRGRPGRPRTAKEFRDLISEISVATPFWGAPRIQGELLKLGIDVSQSTVAK